MHTILRHKLQWTAYTGIAFMVLGLILRLNAQKFSWPKEYSFSGTWDATDWGRHEIALMQLSLILIVFGCGLLWLAGHHWLASPISEAEIPNIHPNILPTDYS